RGEFQLIDFPGLKVPCTAVRWINERGDMAGVFEFVDTIEDCYVPLTLHGFLLRQGEYARIDFPGSTGTQINAINDDGEIVGFYIDKADNTHGFRGEPKDTQ